MRHPNLGVAAQDAVRGRRLRAHREDRPPLPRVDIEDPRVRQRSGSTQQRMQRRDLELDEVRDYREDVRPPANLFLKTSSMSSMSEKPLKRKEHALHAVPNGRLLTTSCRIKGVPPLQMDFFG